MRTQADFALTAARSRAHVVVPCQGTRGRAGRRSCVATPVEEEVHVIQPKLADKMELPA